MKVSTMQSVHHAADTPDRSEARPSLQLLEFPEAPAASAAGKPIAPAIHVFKDVKVQLEVRLGGVATTVGELLAMKEGSVVSLQQGLDEPIELVYQGEVVARGELVAVYDQFGLRITQTAPITL